MKVAIAADHKGVEYKNLVKAILTRLGHAVTDFGTFSDTKSVDYPDFGLQAARAVATGKVDRAITVCWTGNGMNMAVNKVKGIRGGLALNVEMAYLTRLHNNANVLTVSGMYTPIDQLEEIIVKFLGTDFEGGRHTARVEKIQKAESA